MIRLRSFSHRRLPSGRLFTDLARDVIAAVLTIAAAFAVASAYHAAQRADVAPPPVVSEAHP